MMAPLQTGDGGFFDFSGRTKLRLTGNDRLRFLNGQITNDVRKVTESAAIEACVLNAKGKLNADIFLSDASDCFWVDADPDLRKALPARIERYIIADDVQIDDVTDRFSIFHVLSRAAPDVADCQRILSTRRFAETGWDIWADSKFHDASGPVSRSPVRVANCEDRDLETLGAELVDRVACRRAQPPPLLRGSLLAFAVPTKRKPEK